MELSKQKNYQQSFDLASDSLRGKDLRERAEKAQARYEKDRDEERIVISFFSEPYTIRLPQMEFFSPGKRTVSLVTRALLLHYLLKADGTLSTGNWISYKDIPGGLLYAGVLARRVTEPLAKRFGKSARLFREAGTRLGGESAKGGDVSFILQAFPRVSLQYVLWEADDEFPSSVQLLFDSSVDHYLALEDIVVLGQITTGRLISVGGRLSSE